MHSGTARIHYLLIYQTSKLRWALQLVSAWTPENPIFSLLVITVCWLMTQVHTSTFETNKKLHKFQRHCFMHSGFTLYVPKYSLALIDRDIKLGTFRSSHQNCCQSRNAFSVSAVAVRYVLMSHCRQQTPVVLTKGSTSTEVTP